MSASAADEKVAVDLQLNLIVVFVAVRAKFAFLHLSFVGATASGRC